MTPRGPMLGAAALAAAALAAAASFVPAPLGAQSGQRGGGFCFGDGPPAECAWWTVTDFTWGHRVWGGNAGRGSPSRTLLLWEYGVARNVSAHHAVGISGLLIGGRLASEKGVGAVARYRYRIRPGYALDLTAGGTRQGDLGVVRLHMGMGVRFSDVGGLSYVGRSDRGGGTGYAGGRLHELWGLAVGSVLGVLYFTFPET